MNLRSSLSFSVERGSLTIAKIAKIIGKKFDKYQKIKRLKDQGQLNTIGQYHDVMTKSNGTCPLVPFCLRLPYHFRSYQSLESKHPHPFTLVASLSCRDLSLLKFEYWNHNQLDEFKSILNIYLINRLTIALHISYNNFICLFLSRFLLVRLFDTERILRRINHCILIKW